VIVEDDQALCDVTKDYLEESNYDVVAFSRGEEALKYLKSNTIDLLILDLMLPDIDGYSICEEVRLNSNVYIIILSAKHEEEDQLLGLELGADDYIQKPISVKFLVAKINALMNRMADMINTDRICDGIIEMDLLSRVVKKNGQVINLATKEFDLLHLLMINKGRALRKEMLFTKVWGMTSDSEYSTLTVHINRLRDKLEEIPKKPKGIITVWGIGYRYEGIL
jgi:DNA-binding response OmpR family regulator